MLLGFVTWDEYFIPFKLGAWLLVFGGVKMSAPEGLLSPLIC